VKHIWILDIQNGLEIRRRIGLICRRTLENGIKFSFDNSDKKIIIYSNDVDLLNKHVYEFGFCFYRQDIIEFKERRFYNYKIWIKSENEKHLTEIKQIEIKIKI